MNIVFLVAIGLVVWFMSVARSANRLYVQLQAPRNVRFNAGRIEWEQPVKVNNPSPTAISLQAIDLDVLYKGTIIGRANLVGNTTFNTGDTIVVAKAFVGTQEIITVLPAILSNIVSVKLDFVGSIKAYGFNVPVSESYTLNLPKVF